MDLVDQMAELPTAAEHRVRRLRERLEQLAGEGKRWSAEGMKVSRALDLALLEVAQERRS